MATESGLAADPALELMKGWAMAMLLMLALRAVGVSEEPVLQNLLGSAGPEPPDTAAAPEADDDIVQELEQALAEPPGPVAPAETSQLADENDFLEAAGMPVAHVPVDPDEFLEPNEEAPVADEPPAPVAPAEPDEPLEYNS